MGRSLASLTFERALRLPGGEVEHFEGGVVGAGHELGVGGREADVSHRPFVRRHGPHVVHARLPVLDATRVVARHQKVVAVHPPHRPHRHVVGLPSQQRQRDVTVTSS